MARSESGVPSSVDISPPFTFFLLSSGTLATMFCILLANLDVIPHQFTHINLITVGHFPTKIQKPLVLSSYVPEIGKWFLWPIVVCVPTAP